MFRVLRGLVNFAALIIELLLVFRFVFKFFVVNPNTPFVAWMYAITAPLVAPFARILPNLKYSGFVVDFSTLTALIVYAIAAYLILAAIPRPERDIG